MNDKQNIDEQIFNNYFEFHGYAVQFFRENHKAPFGFDNINKGQSQILHILSKSESMSQKELVSHLDMKPQSASEMIKKLERKGYITREKSDSDKRSLIITLTVKGRIEIELEGDFTPVLLESLTEEEKAQFNYLLSKMADDMKGKVKNPPRRLIHNRLGHNRSND